MAFGDFRKKVRRIAFCTLLFWIVLATVVVILMIWNAINEEYLSRIVWSATALTAGILLCCLTYLAFASAEDGTRAGDSNSTDDGDSESLREAFEMAKIKPKID